MLSLVLDCKEEILFLSTPATYTSAQEVLESCRSKMAPRVQQALEGVASRTGEGSSSAVAAPIDTTLKGVSASLLEKVGREIVDATTEDCDIFFSFHPDPEEGGCSCVGNHYEGPCRGKEERNASTTASILSDY